MKKGGSPDSLGRQAFPVEKPDPCRNRCLQDPSCAAYEIPAKGTSGSDWCVTYTSVGASGDGRVRYECYTKSKRKFLREILIYVH